ncbi:MAG: hypothetical protein LQ351_006094 [Letrouitia transgressa]|nr:MAG: hypothetical protein LQ351_006094 [Letrouitia transgressa]
MADLPTEGHATGDLPNYRSESQGSQTASEYINSQLQLEADAREALPYAFDHCTQPLGPLRQILFSCLTCNPPNGDNAAFSDSTSAGICYSCSISCHPTHTLVELFHKRSFTCDCGTSRLPSSSPCTLRIDPSTGTKGPVHSQPPPEGNEYNQNFKNRFCGCGEWYDAHKEKGTMFQCLGLEGGCGEDWWHPECVVGLGRAEWKDQALNLKGEQKPKGQINGGANDGTNGADHASEEEDETDEEELLPPGFPPEDAFESFICYKCVSTHPWLKRYAGTPGFLPVVFKSDGKVTSPTAKSQNNSTSSSDPQQTHPVQNGDALPQIEPPTSSNKRKASISPPASPTKKPRVSPSPADNSTTGATPACSAPPSDSTSMQPLSLFLTSTFRTQFCRCPQCYPLLRPHPHLLEPETTHSPAPASDSGTPPQDARSSHHGSLLEKGEAALSTMDRVRAIEGVMAYNHLKENLKTFLKPFAESGQPVGAEDVKAYFQKLRGDDKDQREQEEEMRGDEGGQGSEGDGRREEKGM